MLPRSAKNRLVHPQVIFDLKFVLCVEAEQTVTDSYLSQDELLRLDSC